MKLSVLERGAPRSTGLSAMAIATALVVAACGGAEDSLPTERASAGNTSPSCDNRVNNTFNKLLECVTLDAILVT